MRYGTAFTLVGSLLALGTAALPARAERPPASAQRWDARRAEYARHAAVRDARRDRQDARLAGRSLRHVAREDGDARHPHALVRQLGRPLTARQNFGPYVAPYNAPYTPSRPSVDPYTTGPFHGSFFYGQQ